MTKLQELQEKAPPPFPDALTNDIMAAMPRILELLLLDRTTSTPNAPKNIIWANDNYIEYGTHAYAATAQINIGAYYTI